MLFASILYQIYVLLTKLEYACDFLVEHNLQVEIIFPMKQGGTKLEYACKVWDGCFERDISKLEQV